MRKWEHGALHLCSHFIFFLPFAPATPSGAHTPQMLHEADVVCGFILFSAS